MPIARAARDGVRGHDGKTDTRDDERQHAERDEDRRPETPRAQHRLEDIVERPDIDVRLIGSRLLCLSSNRRQHRRRFRMRLHEYHSPAERPAHHLQRTNDGPSAASAVLPVERCPVRNIVEHPDDGQALSHRPDHLQAFTHSGPPRPCVAGQRRTHHDHRRAARHVVRLTQRTPIDDADARDVCVCRICGQEVRRAWFLMRRVPRPDAESHAALRRRRLHDRRSLDTGHVTQTLLNGRMDGVRRSGLAHLRRVGLDDDNAVCLEAEVLCTRIPEARHEQRRGRHERQRQRHLQRDERAEHA